MLLTAGPKLFLLFVCLRYLNQRPCTCWTNTLPSSYNPSCLLHQKVFYFICLLCICVCVRERQRACTCARTHTHVDMCVGSPAAEVRGAGEPSSMGAESRTQVLCKSNMSFQLLNHGFNPFLFPFILRQSLTKLWKLFLTL